MRRRLAALPALVALAVALVVLHLAGPASSGANLTTHSANPSGPFTAGTLAAPTAFTAAASGHDVALAYTKGTGATSTYLEVGTSATSSCASTTYANLTTTIASSATDTGRYLPQGTYACYRASSVMNSWTSLTGNPLASAQIGVVVQSVAIVNGGNRAGCAGPSSTAGQIDCGDVFTVTFNQPMDTATGPSATALVCMNLAGSVVLTLGASCLTPAISLTGSGLALSTSGAAATTWSAGNTVLTYRVTSTPALSVTIGTSTALTTAPTTDTTKLKSATGAFHVCDSSTGGGVCTPATTGSV